MANYDRTKWHFDAATGEYYRITGSHRGHIVYDSTPYLSRVLEDQKRAKRRNLAQYGLFFSVAGIFGFAALAYYSAHNRDMYGRTDFGGVIFFGGCVLASVIMLFCSSAELFTSRDDDIGPPPVPPPGREQVEQQMAHGNAGPATIQDIHDALSSNAPATPHRAPAPRGPIYED